MGFIDGSFVTAIAEALNSSFTMNLRHILQLTIQDSAQWASKALLIASLGVLVIQSLGRLFHRWLLRYGFSIGIASFFFAAIIFNIATNEKMIMASIALFVVGLGIVPPIYLSHLRNSSSRVVASHAGYVSSAHTLGYFIGSALTALTIALGFEQTGGLLAILSTGLVFVSLFKFRNTSQNRKWA